MAEKTKTSGDDKVTTDLQQAAEAKAAGVNADNLVTGADYDKVVKSFYDGKMEPGYQIRFVTVGGETKPVVTKA